MGPRVFCSEAQYKSQNHEGDIVQVRSSSEFAELIESETNAILDNPELKTIFWGIDVKIRTAQDRICSSDRFEGSSIATKEEGTVRLEQIKYRYVSNPLNEWKKDFKDPAKVIASIPFARNLAEYIGDKAN